MKKIVKSNKFLILSLFIITIWVIYEAYAVYIHESIISDPIMVFYQIFFDTGLEYFVFLAPLFVLIPAIYQFHKELSSNFIKNSMTRISYKEYMKKHYIKALKKTLILVFFVILLFFISCLITKGIAVKSNIEYYGYYMSPDAKFVENVGLFMFTYVLNVILSGIFYVNLGLIYCKKNHNFIVNIVLSYITFIVLQIIFEVFIGDILFAKFLNIHYVSQALSLWNVWYYCDMGVGNLLTTTLFSLALAIISSLIVFKTYNNKEGVMIECEK
jgi:hypothetical protein